MPPLREKGCRFTKCVVLSHLHFIGYSLTRVHRVFEFFLLSKCHIFVVKAENLALKISPEGKNYFQVDLVLIRARAQCIFFEIMGLFGRYGN